jgi:hypothetical protein
MTSAKDFLPGSVPAQTGYDDPEGSCQSATSDSWDLLSPQDLRRAFASARESPSSAHAARALGDRCAELCSRPGVNGGPGTTRLAAVVASAFGSPVSPQTTVAFLDALCGPAGAGFPAQFVGPLLSDLPIAWDCFTAVDLGQLMVVLLAFCKAQSAPPEASGVALRAAILKARARLSPRDVAVCARVMWDEGHVWGRSAGRILGGLLPDHWKLANFAALLCELTAECQRADELDLLDYDAVDKAADRDGGNPAVRIGQLLDTAGLPAGKEVDAAAAAVRAFRTRFGDADEIMKQIGPPGSATASSGSAGSGTGRAIRPARGGMFVGRVLQQMSFAHEGGYADAKGCGACDWRVAEAVRLACVLCTISGGGPGADQYDWRADRTQHAYFVGDVLRQLRAREYFSSSFASLPCQMIQSLNG